MPTTVGRSRGRQGVHSGARDRGADHARQGWPEQAAAPAYLAGRLAPPALPAAGPAMLRPLMTCPAGSWPPLAGGSDCSAAPQTVEPTGPCRFRDIYGVRHCGPVVRPIQVSFAFVSPDLYHFPLPFRTRRCWLQMVPKSRCRNGRSDARAWIVQPGGRPGKTPTGKHKKGTG